MLHMGGHCFLCVMNGNKVNYPANLSRHDIVKYNYSLESNEENECKYCREPHTSIVALHRPLLKHHPQQVQEERKYLDRENHGKMSIQKLLQAGNISFDVHEAKDMA